VQGTVDKLNLCVIATFYVFSFKHYYHDPIRDSEMISGNQKTIQTTGFALKVRDFNNAELQEG